MCIILYLLTIVASSTCFPYGNELLSARCQSRCLEQLQIRYRDHTRQDRRTFKHHTLQVCQEDEKCSSCLLPCKYFHSHDFTTCKIEACQTQIAKKECDRSCDFLQYSYIEKLGDCPTESNYSQYECSASCHMDGDCSETLKCCSYGCNRRCVLPSYPDNLSSVLPIPQNLTVEERKGKRSVLLRWEMGSNLTHSVTNLYVIQWRWSLHPSDSWTEWQTVTTKSKPSAILKHLVSAGRYYQFRVAAVNSQGSLGFGVPNEPFKLSREVETPSAPRGLSLGDVEMMNGLWNQKIQWTQPISELPIKSYQILWAPSPVLDEDAFEELLKQNSDSDDEAFDDKAWLLNGTGSYHLFAVPGHETFAELIGLLPNHSYFAEIYAVAESEKGDIQGDKSIIFLNSLTNSQTKSTEPSFASELNVPTAEIKEERHEIIIEPANYDGGLQTTVSWWDSRICGPVRTKYIVQLKRGDCREYEPHHILDNNWKETKTGDCDMQLQGLSFDCDYEILVTDKKTGQAITSRFVTPSCSSLANDAKLDCSALTTPLFCSTRRQTVICHWSRRLDDTTENTEEKSNTIVGYRILLTSSAQSLSNITINPPHLREVRYEKLKPFEVYTVEVQSITNRGFGRTASVNFVASFEHFSNNEIMQFPDGHMIELPLSSYSSYSYFKLYILTIIVVINIINNMS